jgi:hypothetical protein
MGASPLPSLWLGPNLPVVIHPRPKVGPGQWLAQAIGWGILAFSRENDGPVGTRESKREAGEK